MPSRPLRAKSLFLGLFFLLAALIVIFMLGPRTPVDTTIAPVDVGPDVDAWLAQSEAAFPDIRGGLAKQVVWADPETKARTPLAIVYVHGFSASSGEVRPLPDLVAAEFGANLFFTRLAGHGRSGDAMAEASVNAWVNDLAEAVAVGRRIGERVVLMGTSTGATLMTWGATQPALMEDVAALVQISPNYGLQAAGSQVLTWPWGRRLANLIVGPRRGFTPQNELHGRLWTADYPTDALLPMAALVKLARSAEIHNIQVPSLFIYSPADRIIRPDRVEAVARRWGAAARVETVETTGDPMNHVIAGEALSPETTEALADLIVDYLRPRVASGARAGFASGLASRENR